MIQWGYNVGCHQQFGDMFWFIQLVIPFYILFTNGIACFIDDVIVPADDMGVVGHTQKTQTPMSSAK